MNNEKSIKSSIPIGLYNEISYALSHVTVIFFLFHQICVIQTSTTQRFKNETE